MAVPGVPRAVHPVAVSLPGTDPLDLPVPDVVRDLRQRHPALGAVVVEQAQVNRLAAAEDRERRPCVVGMSTEAGNEHSATVGDRC